MSCKALESYERLLAQLREAPAAAQTNAEGEAEGEETDSGSDNGGSLEGFLDARSSPPAMQHRSAKDCALLDHQGQHVSGAIDSAPAAATKTGRSCFCFTLLCTAYLRFFPDTRVT